MLIDVRLSAQHYLLDGLVYSAGSVTADDPLVVMASVAKGDYERAKFAQRFNLVPPGTTGKIVGTAMVNGSMKYSVQFDGAATPVAVSGKFLEKIA